jgi:predicted ATPase/DNA-binding SARP family transcriptional activator
MKRLDFYLLGAPRLTLDGVPVSLERRKALALLAYLALNSSPQSREVLAALFWPDYVTRQAFAYLRQAIWAIKDALGAGWLEAGREMVSLEVRPEFWLDVAAFRELSASCPPDHFTSDDLANLAAAVELYRGDFMAGFALPDSLQFEEWQFFQAEELRHDLRNVLEKLNAGYAELGDPGKALPYARRRVALDPLDEAAQRALMRLFAISDQRSAALRQYELCAKTLKEQVGAAPEPETTALYEQIRSGKYPGQTGSDSARWVVAMGASPVEGSHAVEVVALQPTARLDNIPAQYTSFIGRTQELAELRQLLYDPACRILTLLGPGGVGKTRLSIQLAESQRAEFSHGVCFAPLASVDSPDGLIPALAKNLGLVFSAQGGDNRQQLLAALAPRQALIVLDNFEHLITDETVGLLLDIAAEARKVKLLITSRIGLNVAGEQHYLLSGMHTPELSVVDADPQAAAAFTAVRLFIDRARRIDPGFELSASNQRPVIHICRAVHGMPLAIELAAAWLELLSPDEIVAEIERGLDFLESELRDLPPRQRSLRAIFNSTWELLSQTERAIFMQLSVFQGGFTRLAAQEVANASLRDLATLANKSLLWRSADGRYEIHELLCQYAAEQLGKLPQEWQAAYERLAETFARQVFEDGERLKTADQLAAFKAIEADFDNIRLAWQWVVEHHHFDLFQRLLFGFTSYLDAQALERESVAFLDAAIQELERLETPGNLEKRLLAELLTQHSLTFSEWTTNKSVVYLQRALELRKSLDPADQFGIWYTLLADGYGLKVDDQAAFQMLRENLEILRQRGDRWGMALTLLRLGERYAWTGAADEARQSFEEAAELFRSLGDQYQLADCLNNLARLADQQQAESMHQQALDIYEKLGNRAAIGQTLFELGHDFVAKGDYPQALTYYQRSLDCSIELGLHLFIPSILSYASITVLRQGDYSLARQLRERSLATARAENELANLIWGKWELGEIERVEGNLETARRLYDESLELFEYSRTANLHTFYQRGLGDIAETQGRYAEAQQHFKKSLELAQADSHRWAVCYAFSGLGRAAIGLGDYTVAQQYFHQAIEFFDHFQGLLTIAISGMAELSAAQGEYERAVTLATFAIEQPATWQEFRDRATKVLLRCIPRLPAAAVAEAQAKARNMNLETLLSSEH